MERTPSLEDPYAVFAELTTDPYLSQLSPLPPTPHSARAPSFPPATPAPQISSAPQVPISPPATQPERSSYLPHQLNQAPTLPPAAQTDPNFLFNLQTIDPAHVPREAKRYPKFSSATTAHTPTLATLRRQLVAILCSRIPLSNEDIANPIMDQAFVGPLTLRVWRLVYELADMEGVAGNREKEKEVDKLKRRLVRELVGRVGWEPGMDGGWEAGRLVEDLWPRGKI
ncbi:hypothetical protein PMIN03_009144 [Paraphaeosphaeria minitans]